MAQISNMIKWCQQQLRYFPEVASKVQNLHSSWKSGQVLCTLIYTFSPQTLPDYPIMSFPETEAEALVNLHKAFDALKQLGIHSMLLDPEDFWNGSLEDNPREFAKQVLMGLQGVYANFSTKQPIPPSGQADISSIPTPSQPITSPTAMKEQLKALKEAQSKHQSPQQIRTTQDTINTTNKELQDAQVQANKIIQDAERIASKIIADANAMNEKCLQREKSSIEAEKNAVEMLKEANGILAESKLAKDQKAELPKISLEGIDQDKEENAIAALCSPRSARMLNKAQSRLEQANAKEILLKNAEKEADELMNKAKALMEEVEKKRSLLNQAQTDQQQADLSAQELINKANLMLKDVEAREKKIELASKDVEKASSGKTREGSALMMSCIVVGIIGVVAGYFMQSYFPLSH